jgi:hypothetical protein
MPSNLLNAPAPTSDWKLIIPPAIYQRLYYYVQAVPYEISGFMRASIDPETSEIIADDIIILEQDSSSAHTEMTPEAQAKYLLHLMETDQNPADWCIWWHSHGNLESFWSGVDDATIEAHTTQPFLISLVTNRQQHSLARVDTWTPRVAPFDDEKLHHTEHIAVITSLNPDPALQATINAEVAEKVRHSITTFTAPNYITPQYNYTAPLLTQKHGWSFDDDTITTEAEARDIATKQYNRKFDVNGYDQDGFDIYGYSLDLTYRDDKDLMT